MFEEMLSRLLSEQTARGAFESTVESCGEIRADETCFVTAQIALILSDIAGWHANPDGRVAWALDRALDFIEACSSERVPGAFLFYPAQIDSPRLPIRLAPDGDDTALAWLALLRGGRRSKLEARAILPPLFERLRAVATQRGDPPWIKAGVYRTWFDPSASLNPADVCVNANILAVLADAGCVPPPSDRVAGAVNAACRAADLSRSTLRSLAPFYADVTELAIAFERAVAAGVTALMPACSRLRSAGLDLRDRQAGRPERRLLYCNAHGRPLWRSASLQRARRCHDLLHATFAPQQPSHSAPGVGNAIHV